MPDNGGLFGGIAEGYLQGQQADLAQRQRKASALADLLHDPNVSADAKAQVMPVYAQVLGIDKKHHGLLQSLGNLFHPGQQDNAPTDWASIIYGTPEQRNQMVQGTPTVGETLASRLDRAKAGLSAQSDQEQGLLSPPSPDPQMGVLQNYVRRGDLTANDIALANHLKTLGVQSQYEGQKQQEMQDRQDFLVKSRAEENRKLQQMKGDQAYSRLTTRDQNRMDLLHEGEKLKAQRRTAELAAAYPDATPDEIAGKVQQEIQAGLDLKTARTAYLNAQTKEIPETTAIKWANLDQNALRNEIYRTATGNAAQREMHRQAVDPMLDELKSVERSIEYLSRFDPAKNPAQAAQLAQEQAHKQGLLNEIWKVNGRTSPQVPTSTVPSRGGRGSKYVPPKVSMDRLKQLMQ